jgi:hypothetical protein
MKPEYVEEMKKLGVPCRAIRVFDRLPHGRLQLAPRDGSLTKERMVGYAKMINEYHALKSAVEDLMGLLSVAKCPNCDGSGFKMFKTGVIDDGIEEARAEPCQWCYERHEALKETEGLI